MLAYVAIGLMTGGAYALLAAGFVLVYRGTRIFNLAHGETGATGLYVGWAVLAVAPPAVAAVAAVCVAALVGLVMERTLARRLVDRTPLAALASTLGAGLALAYAQAFVWGYNIKTFPSPFGTGAMRVGSLTVTAPRAASLVAAAVVAIGIGVFLKRTRFGLEILASTSDQALARLSGVRVDRVRAGVWATAGALSGLSAVLLAPIYTFHPLSNTLVLVRAMAAALIGGMSLPGAFAGGLAVGVVESLVVSQTGLGGAADGAIFALVLVVLIARPGGLLRLSGSAS